MLQRLSLLLAALWWGSATAVGAWVVPMLFRHLGSPAVAGAMAGRLFTAQTWVALLCGLMLLWVLRRISADQGSAAVGMPDRSRRDAIPKVTPKAFPNGDTPAEDSWIPGRSLEVWILAGMLAAAVMTWGVSPRILAREQLALWHAVGSALYAVQWLAGGVTLWRLGRVSPANAS